MSEHVVCDLDDYCDAHADWALPELDRLYARSRGRFKATLFVIPARTSERTFAEAAQRPYLELAVHGWDHRPLECEKWTRERTLEVLDACPQYARLFKAPYWTASLAVYEALTDAGWAVAVHPSSTGLPCTLKRYALSPWHEIGAPHHILPVIQAHGHITNEAGNGLRENLGRFVALCERGLPFKFVSEVLV